MKDHPLKTGKKSQIIIQEKYRKRKNSPEPFASAVGENQNLKPPGKLAHHLSSALNTGFVPFKKRLGLFYDVGRTSVVDKYVFRRGLGEKCTEMVNKVMARNVDLDLFG